MCLACSPGLLTLGRMSLSRRGLLRSGVGLAIVGGLPVAALAQTEDLARVGKEANGPAEIIFHGGPIITMNDAAPRVEALAVRAGRISAVGRRDDVMAQQGTGTRVIDLAGRTMLPGFVEPHIHTTMTFLDQWLNVGPFSVSSVGAAVGKIREAVRSAQSGEWVRAQGLDPSLMAGASITRRTLDAFAPDNPIFIIESNGHIAYVNTKALDLAGVTRDSADPPTARYVRGADGELTGRLEEPAAYAAFIAKMPAQSSEDFVSGIQKLFDRASAMGCTALHDCGIGNLSGKGDLFAVQQAMDRDPPVRMSGQLVSTIMDDWVAMGIRPNQGSDGFRLTGIKAWSDGSNQGLTGYFREPYLGSKNRGALNYTPEHLTAVVQRAHDLGWQVSVHANGDAAIDVTLRAYEAVLSKTPRSDHRHRIEHCSVAHPEQLKKMAQLGLSPSFLIGHVYYWGRAFRDIILGPERAEMLDPCASALKAGLRISLHSDYNVTPIEPLRYIHNAVTRELRDGGDILNPAERITPMQAIRAVTLDAAWQSRIDHICGSLEVGKYADLVVLDADPTVVRPEAIKGIAVAETWLEGRRRFAA